MKEGKGGKIGNSSEQNKPSTRFGGVVIRGVFMRPNPGPERQEQILEKNNQIKTGRY